MKLAKLSAAAALSLAGVTGASAQVYIVDDYAGPAYAAPAPVYAAPAPVYAAPAPVYAAPTPVYAEPAPVIVAPSPRYVVRNPIGGYVPPRYSYTINGGYGPTYAAHRGMGTCFVDVDGFRTCD